MSIEPPHLDRHELVRRANLHNVLASIAAYAPITRAQLVERTGLSRPTVLSVVDALAEDGLIRSSTHSTGAVGRAPLRYEPDPSAGYVIGIDLGGTKVRVALADLLGSILGEVEEATTRHGAEALLDQLDGAVRRLARASRARLGKIAAVTVGSPGVVHADGTVHLAQNVTGLDELALGPDLALRLRCPVRVDNDVNLAALGELADGVAADCRTFVVLSVGTGIGAAIVIDGRVLSGAHGAAGEVAYLPCGADPMAPSSRRRGAFEVAASGSGVQAMLADELHARTPSELTTTLQPGSDARATFAAAAGGDEVALSVVARHARLLAEATLCLVAVIDPEMVVLAGGIGSDPVLLQPLRDALERIAPFPVRVETTTLGSRAGLVGAVADAQRRAWQALFQRHPLGPVPVDGDGQAP